MSQTDISTTKTSKELWLEHYLKTGDAIAAVEYAYPECGAKSSDPKSAKTIRASQLKAELAPKLSQRLRDGLAYDAHKALKAINMLVDGAKQESVKLAASRDILDRAGIGTEKNGANTGVTVIVNTNMVSPDQGQSVFIQADTDQD